MTGNELYIPYGRHWISDDDIESVVDVLESDWLTQGPKIEEFEKEISAYCGSNYAVVFNSGTSALHAAFSVLRLNKDDEFITTPNTFVATANAGLHTGIKPIFVDIEEDTGNLNTSKVEERITERTRLIVPVHYSGHPVDMGKIYEIAERKNLYVIEDACHALGAKYKGYKTGGCNYSDMTVFSFHPVKHITTGEGGAVLTNNKDFYKKLLMSRSHGIEKRSFINKPDGDWYYEMQSLGYNYRMTDIQAALGISQFRKLDKFIDRRKEIARLYDSEFKDNPWFDIPPVRSYASSSYHLYPIRFKDGFKEKKKEIFLKLKEEKLGVQVHYIPVYWHPFYKNMGYKKGICPIAEDFYFKELSLPIYPAMKGEEQRYVIEGINTVMSGYAK
ncbi:MAG: UDP-4-amino-4,6-dideoxy-N-acetyl-beta-L-altrosamine transaminase [Nitrospirae bacterium RIFCSPLOW2_12_42_9]|nr:MAG: UDP-4-amino-4,6-dideoxy-N-acetyl-beta-L-altrosamine transaminase [Nitrospirae bacterium RIFCSPLOW2_12_42_9]